MKKEGKFLIVLFLVFLVSISLVNAKLCDDSVKKYSIYESGSLIFEGESYSDYCSDGIYFEGRCEGDEMIFDMGNCIECFDESSCSKNYKNPDIIILSPKGNYNLNSNVDISVTSDKIAAITAEITLPDFSVSSVALVKGANSYSYSYTPVKAGDYSVKIIAIDSFGRINDTEKTNFKVLGKYKLTCFSEKVSGGFYTSKTKCESVNKNKSGYLRCDKFVLVYRPIFEIKRTTSCLKEGTPSFKCPSGLNEKSRTSC